MDEYVTTLLYYYNHIQIKVETNFFLMYPLIISQLAKRIHSHVANPYKCVSELHQPAEQTGKKVIKNETIFLQWFMRPYQALSCHVHDKVMLQFRGRLLHVHQIIFILTIQVTNSWPEFGQRYAIAHKRCILFNIS